MQVEMMRTVLHEAIDRIIDEYLDVGAAMPLAKKAGLTDEGIVVVEGEDHGPFPYRWPDGNDEPFSKSRWYTLEDRGREYRVLAAWTEREAWGRTRKRAVVFGENGSSLYPWTEFVETDDGRFAAGMPDPTHPRALLKFGAAIPDWFGTATVERTDQLFRRIRQGPSLRLVVGSDEERRMVRHGYWVAGLRNRL